VLLDGYVDVVINMFTKGGKEERDGFKIRSLASQKNIQVFTCMETALALGKSVSKKLVLKTVALQDIPKPFKI
jgi:hypothetical protein